MLNKIKQNAALVVGFGIPLAMILLIAGVVYAPKLFHTVTPPAHDFMYGYGPGVYPQEYGPGAYASPYYPSNGGPVWPKYNYQVMSGKLTKIENLPQVSDPMNKNIPVSDQEPKFYVYHVGTGLSEPITIEAAQAYMLDTGARSPDGYEIVRGGGGGGVFPFFYDGGRDYNSRFLQKKGYSVKLELNLPSTYYNDPFVAWIVSQ